MAGNAAEELTAFTDACDPTAGKGGERTSELPERDIGRYHAER